MKKKKQPNWLPDALKRYHKIYDAFIFTQPATTIQVVDDSGYVKTYKGERFMVLDEFRERKLKELGI